MAIVTTHYYDFGGVPVVYDTTTGQLEQDPGYVAAVGTQQQFYGQGSANTVFFPQAGPANQARSGGISGTALLQLVQQQISAGQVAVTTQQPPAVATRPGTGASGTVSITPTNQGLKASGGISWPLVIGGLGLVWLMGRRR